MNHRFLGRTGFKVSELCLGSMQFGWTADEPASFAIMDAFVEAGGNFIDTADIYSNWTPQSHGGKSEEIIGRWMKARDNRSRTIIATKVRGGMGSGPNDEGLSRHRVIRCCEDSLRRMQTDYIDLYQCHWADLNTPIDETLAALDQLVRDGKVRYIGASNYPAWRLMEALWQSDKHGYARFHSYQPEYSLMERAAFEIEMMPLCKHHGIGVIPYSPLAAGFLTGKYRRGQTVDSVRAKQIGETYCNDRGYAVIDALDRIAKANNRTVAQVSLAWLLANPVVTSPIIGANSLSQLAELTAVSGFSLSEADKKELDGLTSYPRGWRPIWD